MPWKSAQSGIASSRHYLSFLLLCLKQGSKGVRKQQTKPACLAPTSPCGMRIPAEKVEPNTFVCKSVSCRSHTFGLHLGKLACSRRKILYLPSYQCGLAAALLTERGAGHCMGLDNCIFTQNEARNLNKCHCADRMKRLLTLFSILTE